MSFQNNTYRTLRNTIFAGVMGSMVACANSGGSTDSSQGGYGYGKKASNSASESERSKVTPPLSLIDTDIGTVVGGGIEQKTLYFFDNDTGTESSCYDACAAAWPPFLATDPSLATETLTISVRTDGSQQWGINGKPVYFWAGDQKAGDTTGAAIPDWTVVMEDAI